MLPPWPCLPPSSSPHLPASPPLPPPQATGGYEGVFLAAACLYGLSWAVFMGVLRGQPIRLKALA